MKLSDQAVASIMMALQRSIMDMVDVTRFLKEFEFYTNAPDQGELFVRNPPILYKDGELAAKEKEKYEKEAEAEAKE
tara:strand:- start:6488 stop:6718 length:231 start_codon:yes stop_codon:yes gene_type:complete